jgi:ectoine hydroxylase-related dioxygenase (phytanoyl-CoA dioxygenase family)
VSPLRLALPATAVARWRAALEPSEGVSRPLTALPLDAAEVLQTVAASAAGPALVHALGAAPWCNLAQSWLRHGRPAHHWHQDGALKHDFLAHAGRHAPPDAALEMRTLWIALTPCGVHAPGLQWVNAELHRLLLPAELTEDAVATRFDAGAFEHAELQPGEALLFDGLLLHRTHLTAAMQAARLSLELRFFRADALPARVASDAGLNLPAPPAPNIACPARPGAPQR